jgi:bifunctional DNA-binding transcriptional regulator/antitoxin component of YhaV-PrlF toxin-antitoxin module
MMTQHRSENAGVVRISEQGVVVIPVEVREVLGINGEDAFVRIEHVSVAKMIDEGEPSDGVESVGIVKISDQGVVNIPIAVRRVLEIDDNEAYVRIKDVSVVETDKVENDGGGS